MPGPGPGAWDSRDLSLWGWQSGGGETDDKQAKQTNVCVCINYKLWEGLKWGRVEGESLWGGDLGRGEGAGM